MSWLKKTLQEANERHAAKKLRQIVFEALDCAVENDTNFSQFSKHVKGATYAIAQDLGTLCPDLEGIEPNKLIPDVEAWLRQHDTREDQPR